MQKRKQKVTEKQSASGLMTEQQEKRVRELMRKGTQQAQAQAQMQQQQQMKERKAGRYGKNFVERQPSG
jgi:hypothetical protein